jgi:hypothetical protein
VQVLCQQSRIFLKNEDKNEKKIDCLRLRTAKCNGARIINLAARENLHSI